MLVKLEKFMNPVFFSLLLIYSNYLIFKILKESSEHTIEQKKTNKIKQINSDKKNCFRSKIKIHKLNFYSAMPLF